MARARSGSDIAKSLKMFVYGQQGTYKSTLALDTMRLKTVEGNPFKVLYLDCETGSVDFYISDLEQEGINPQNLYIIYSSSYNEIEYYANKFIKNETFYTLDEDGNETEEEVLDADGLPIKFDAIVIDGITVLADNINEAALNVSEKRAKVRADIKKKTSDETFVDVQTAGLEFKDHTKIKSKGKSLIRKLVTGTDKCVVITGRDKAQKVMKSNKSGDMQLVDTGLRVAESWDFINFEVFTVIHMYSDNETGEVYGIIELKDRTGTYLPNSKLKVNETYDRPSLLDWQHVITENKGKQRFDIKEDVNKSMANNEKAYEQIANDKAVTFDGSNNKEEPKEETVDSLKEQIKSERTQIPKHKLPTVQAAIKAEKIPLSVAEIDDIDVLKKYLEIIKNT